MSAADPVPSPPAAADNDAEEGEILDDEDEAETAAAEEAQPAPQHTPQHKSDGSGKSSSSDKHRAKSTKCGRDSSSRSKSRKRPAKDGDEAEKAKKQRSDSHDDSDDSVDSSADDEATKQRLLMQVMQIMLNASKKGKKSDKKTIELMDKMIKRGSDVSAKEVREVVRKNKRLLRGGSRDRRSRSRSRDRRSRSDRRRDSNRNNRNESGHKDGENKTSRPDVDPRTGVGLLKEKCKFFAEGKCHKGFECPFSHEVILTKKREICKFYLQGFCGKGEHCFFMHEEFPCKFFHTGAECYSGDNCRFSHQPLTEEGRAILRGYLDSGELPDDHLRARPVDGENSGAGSTAAAGQITAPAAPASSAATTYQPVKPVPKRHAILGDVTDAMRTSYYTWQWQQELKELEMAYTGNKRNLFCVEKQFVVHEKPPTPPPEIEDPDEVECKIMSYYIDTMGDVDIRQLHPGPHLFSSEPEACVQDQSLAEEEDLFLMSAAHDEDLRIPLPQRPESVPAIDTSQTGGAGDVATEISEQKWPSRSEDTVKTLAEPIETYQAMRELDTGGGDSPSGHTESKSKPKYDIAKMLNVIRQSSSQQSANSSQPAPGHSEFWQNIFSGTSFAAGSSPTSSSAAQRSPSQVKDPRLKKDVRPEDTTSALQKQSGADLAAEGENSEFRLFVMTVPGIDYSPYFPLYHSDTKLRNDPRLQKFFTRQPSLDHLTQLLPSDSSSKSLTSSAITQSTLASLMSSSSCNSNISSNNSSPAKCMQDQDDRLTPSSPPHLTGLTGMPALPPLTLNAPPKTQIVSIVPPPPPAMSPLELMTSKPFSIQTSLNHPHTGSPQLSLRAESAFDDCERLKRDSENGNNLAMDLSAKTISNNNSKHDQQASDRLSLDPVPAAAVSDDTPASPASRRSSCDALLSPPLIQPASPGDESAAEATAGQDLKNVFGAIDPTASPFC